MCKACFSPEGSGRSRNVQIEVREAFVKDLNPDGSNFPSTLGELAERLKNWRNRLQTELEDKMPGVLRLEDECRALQVRRNRERTPPYEGYQFQAIVIDDVGVTSFVWMGTHCTAALLEYALTFFTCLALDVLQEMQLTDVEMPGQYLAGHEITADNTVYLEHISSNVAIVRRHSTSFRRLAFVGSDGRTRHMLVQTGQNSSQGMADERMMQLLRLLNKLLDKHPESRRRLLNWHTPVIVPVWPQVRVIVYSDALRCLKSWHALTSFLMYVPANHNLQRRLLQPDGTCSIHMQGNASGV